MALLTPRVARYALSGTTTRVAARASDRGSTARVAAVAPAAIAAVAAVSGARSRAACVVSGSVLGPRGWWQLVGWLGCVPSEAPGGAGVASAGSGPARRSPTVILTPVEATDHVFLLCVWSFLVWCS